MTPTGRAAFGAPNIQQLLLRSEEFTHIREAFVGDTAEVELPRTFAAHVENLRMMSHGASLIAGKVREAGMSESAADRAEAYTQLRGALEEISGALKPLSDLCDSLKSRLIPEAFEREGLSTITLKSGFRVTISQVVRASVREGMREAAFQWLKEHGRDSLITETINSSTLSAAVKHDLEAGMDWSDKIFNVHVLPQVSVTKTKS